MDREAGADGRRGDVTRVKICGLRRREDVEAAASAGADYAGFVFAPSPRRVEEGRVEALMQGLDLTPVGVFVDAASEEVLATAEREGLRVVQLHGSESPEICAALREAGLEVWKAVRPRSRRELARQAERYRRVDALLVEGHSPVAAGGTGTSFPYEWLSDRPGAGGGGTEGPVPVLVLAGGLSPETVAAAIRAVRPRVVDVSSGVERAPGEKDPRRIRAFVRAARGALSGEAAGAAPRSEAGGQGRG